MPRMAEAVEPPEVKLICGMISADKTLFDAATERLSESFGGVDIISDDTPFDLTHYYDAEMSAPLLRRFVAFAEPVKPDSIVEVKLATNGMERDFAAAAGNDPARPINLDPGYIAASKLVLASMKNFSHRIYLSAGVWAEITLMYQKGEWRPLPWTFPDYASGRYDNFLTSARKVLLSGAQSQKEACK